MNEEETNIEFTPEALEHAKRLTVSWVKKMAKTMFCGTPVLRAAKREKELMNSQKGPVATIEKENNSKR